MSDHHSKRKHDISEESSKRRKVEEVGTDDLGIKDYISHLPTLCLLEILKHLRKKTLFQMLTVNKTIYSITKDMSLDHLKRKDCSIIISKTDEGFGFEFLVEYKNNPIRDKQLHYEAIKNEEGEIIESNQIDGALPATQNAIHHRWPVPDELFTALNKTIEKYEIKYLTIRQIRFDEELIATLGRILIGHRSKMLNLDIINLENVNQSTFVQLIKRFKYVEIKETDFVESIFNRQFLIEIGQSRLRSFWWDIHILSAMEYSFEADEAIIRCIAHLKSLNAFGIIVRADWVADLVMRHLDEAALKHRTKYIGKWRFTLDEKLTETHMRPVINATNYQYSLENDTHRIVEKNSGLTATIREMDHIVNGTLLHGINVAFTKG